MTIIIFLVDTSASMNQRTFLGTSLLDIAKGAVEMFMKFRSRDPASRMDRYMLLTFEDPPANIKAGWKESHATFMSELKNLTCTGLSTLGPSLKYTFDLLNVNRMQSGVDTYGQGRSPFYLEPAVIICITDGCKMTTSTNVQKELNLPMNTSVPGSSLTKEPFRWDQRLFGLVLRIPAVPPQDTGSLYIPAADDCQIDLMCDVTGGRSYMINSHRVLVKSLESLVQKVQPGVVINFEKWGPDPPPVADNEETKSSTPTPQSTNWHNCNKMIFVPRSAQRGYSIGHWPIPEAYWPDTTDTLDLPPRTAHPIVKFSCTNSDAMVVENLPFDKYEVEPSPLTQYILERRQPNIAWQVYISNSAKYSTDIGHPFGYLKPSSNLMTVNLFIMPYNYPVLLPLLDDLFKVLKGKPNMKWRHDFENYLKSMPIYYAPCLRRAMARMGAPNLIPEHMDNSLNYKVVNHLKKLKLQAKVEYDKLVTSVGQTLPVVEGIKVVPKKNNSILLRQDLQQLLNNYDGDVIAHLKQELAEYNTFTLGIPSKKVVPNTYKNPYDISRSSLLDQLTRMRSNLLHMNRPTLSLKPAKHDDDDLHSIPVQQMGNYQEYLKKMPAPLRELETAPVRQHMFGNPFKVNKNLMIDEADEAMPGQPSPSRKRQADTPPGSPMPRRRKPGPLPKDTPYRRPSTPSIESAANKYAPTLLSIDSESEKDTSDDSGMESDDSLFSLNSSGESEVIKPEPIRGAVLINEPIGNTGLLNEPIRGPLLLNKVCDTNGHIDTLHNGDSSYKAHNKLIVQKANREVKKPGKKHTVLFEHLQKLQGPVDVKCVHIRDLMHQASRFKRRQLISLLEQFEQSLLVNTNGNGAR